MEQLLVSSSLPYLVNVVDCFGLRRIARKANGVLYYKNEGVTDIFATVSILDKHELCDPVC